jgi:hypothetical protein
VDGGVIDNLGLGTLAHTYQLQDRLGYRFDRGCLLILIDAGLPQRDYRIGEVPDTRTAKDAVVDTNFLASIGILMGEKSKEDLKAMGFDEYHWAARVYKLRALGNNQTILDFRSPQEIVEPPSFLDDADISSGYLGPVYRNRRLSCRVWHIALADLTPFSGYNAPYKRAYGNEFYEYGRNLANLGTRFEISDEQADSLFTAAKLLVEDPASRRTICGWVLKVAAASCPPAPSGDSSKAESGNAGR